MENRIPSSRENRNPSGQKNKSPLDYGISTPKIQRTKKMVNKTMYQKIQKCKRKGWLKSRISKELGLDPTTIAKYYNMGEGEYRKYVNSLMYRGKVFDRYKDKIIEVYKENDYRVLSVSAIYDYLEEQVGQLPAGERSLRNYIKYLEETDQLEFKEGIRVYGKVAELPMGKQLQVDFGEYITKSGLKLYIFAAILSASRYRYVSFQDRPFTTLDVIKHLLDCFEYIGGVPEELVIDQDKVMVVSENHGDIIYTKDFAYFVQEKGLRMWVCRKADFESKGRVENLVKYVKYNFLSVRDFKVLKEAQESLQGWLIRRANGKIFQAMKRIPLEMIEEERLYLRSLRNSIYGKSSICEREERTAEGNALISVSASWYSVPERYRNKVVEIYKTDSKVFIFDRRNGKQIAEHKLSLIPGRRVINKEHYRKNGKSTKEMKEEVLNRFQLERWPIFVQANFKHYSRYVRDQCLEAQRRFGDDIDFKCLDQGTYTMANLDDTYKYYKGIGDGKGKDILGEIGGQLKAVSRYRSDIQVSKRDLGVYKSIVNVITGVLR